MRTRYYGAGPGSRNVKGYGMIWNREKQRPGHAHRVVGELANGRPVPDGLNVLHTIRERVASGVSQRVGGAEFGVTQSAVSLIVRGKHWRG